MSPKALVIGLGKSGIAAIRFLLQEGYQVRANDKKNEQILSESIKQFKGQDVEFILGQHNNDLLEGIDRVIVSPGVPTELPLIQKAKQNKLVISEVELAYQYYPENWICITGTDGKSTTTSLIGAILKTNKLDTIVAGNIGIPLTESILNAKKGSYVVAELSSFQLENIINLKPKIGVLLNIAEDHLDRYNNMEEYTRAKFNLFNNQTNNEYSIFNANNLRSNQFLKQTKIKSNQYFFNFHKPVEKGAYYQDDIYYWKDNNKIEKIMKDGIQKIKGSHNKENILAAITGAKLLHIPNKIIEDAVKNFNGLAHRMEFVRDLKGHIFYNDSKATTISAVREGLEGFNNIVLIMGGRDKGLNFSELNDVLNRKVKYLILIGEAKDKIKNSIDYPEDKIFLTDDFDVSIQLAYEKSSPGE